MLKRIALLALVAATPAWAADAPAGSAAEGQKLYVTFGCYECHGYVGQGGAAGPRIAPGKSFKALTNVLREPDGDMPPYTAKVLSDQQVADLWAYLTSIPTPPNADTIALLKKPGS